MKKTKKKIQNFVTIGYHNHCSFKEVLILLFFSLGRKMGSSIRTSYSLIHLDVACPWDCRHDFSWQYFLIFGIYDSTCCDVDDLGIICCPFLLKHTCTHKEVWMGSPAIYWACDAIHQLCWWFLGRLDRCGSTESPSHNPKSALLERCCHRCPLRPDTTHLSSVTEGMTVALLTSRWKSSFSRNSVVKPEPWPPNTLSVMEKSSSSCSIRRVLFHFFGCHLNSKNQAPLIREKFYSKALSKKSILNNFIRGPSKRVIQIYDKKSARCNK